MALKPAAITHVPESTLHISEPTWWLTSRFHFSFADWFDPSRSHFGVLRVVNDDLVKAREGFGTHPHRNAEIFSYIVDGELSHKDSMGNKESLPRGCVQYLSAGTGITHSEMNDGAETCRFLQIWLTPDQNGHKPQYGSTRFTHADRHNKLLHLLGGTSAPPTWDCLNSMQPISLHQDVNVVVSESDPGCKMEVALAPRRQAYLICIEGSVAVNGVTLGMRDAARIHGLPGAPTSLALEMGPQGGHLLMVEMPLST